MLGSKSNQINESQISELKEMLRNKDENVIVKTFSCPHTNKERETYSYTHSPSHTHPYSEVTGPLVSRQAAATSRSWELTQLALTLHPLSHYCRK